jgi:pyrroline-5-carboxylate reductase
MTLDAVNTSGLVLLGCGKMGSALLAGWLENGVAASSVWVIDPYPSEWLRGTGCHLNTELPPAPSVVILAVKPQMMGEALPVLTALGNGKTVFISIAAGTAIKTFEALLGHQTPIVRTMPNTPAAVGRGITALIGNSHATAANLALAETLLAAVGQTVRLQNEGQMDAVTAVSGSGPAYVFHMIEALAAAGVEQGLPAEMALHLARATVAGAGQLAESADETPGQLRINVTSPGGTTAAALAVLMDPSSGFGALISSAVAAAAARSKELGA